MKWADKKVRWRCTSYNQGMRIVPNQGIKCADEMDNCVWENANITGINANTDAHCCAVRRQCECDITDVCITAGNTHWHAMGTKQTLFNYSEIVLYNVFTATRNAVDLSMHGKNKKHTKYMKEHEDRYVAVVKNLYAWWR